MHACEKVLSSVFPFDRMYTFKWVAALPAQGANLNALLGCYIWSYILNNTVTYSAHVVVEETKNTREHEDILTLCDATIRTACLEGRNAGHKSSGFRAVKNRRKDCMHVRIPPGPEMPAFGARALQVISV